MKILAFKPDHDGHIALLDRDELVFSIEAEKDSFPRFSPMTPDLHLRAMELLDGSPDVVAVSGWLKTWGPEGQAVDGGYFGEGTSTISDRTTSLLGHKVRRFSSSHERSHLLCAYGMSPYPQGQPVYALVWEGCLGAFYRIDENVDVRRIGTVLERPGDRYAWLYALANEKCASTTDTAQLDAAGKLMALVGFGEPGPFSPDEEEVRRFLMSDCTPWRNLDKHVLRHNPLYNCGVESSSLKNMARKFSDHIFDVFYQYAKEHLREGLPLLIVGGCGLNCDWNSAWVRSGLFSDVFVPPCPNDSGSAIGTAIDALRHYTGAAKIRWSVYAGEEFVDAGVDVIGFEARPLDDHEVAEFLRGGATVAWVQGRYEIGPRALGNRSLLAAPFDVKMLHHLNRIKQREGYRPIAPVCLEDEMDPHFGHHGPSPHMLFFQTVKSRELAAITHADGSARLQSVSASQNPALHRLLTAFKRATGHGVLCNTSLNFKGAGFINRMSDLVSYVNERGIDGFVVGDRFFRPRCPS